MIPPNEITLLDLFNAYDLIATLRKSTVPVNEHIDPLEVDECWDQLTRIVDSMGLLVKDKLVTKESLEALIGKKIVTFEKIYDEKGILREVKVQPVAAVEYIEMQFKIIPESELNDTQL